MNYLVIYPGRFHIFHLGHKAVYEYLVRKWAPLGGSVFIATSSVQAPVTSPFSYEDKVAMLTKMGVPASHILKVSNPYSIDEYANGLPDPENTVLIFAIGAKDQQLVKDANGKVTQKPRFDFKPKKDGSPPKVQQLPERLTQCRPVSDKVAYVDIVDTQEFKVQGKPIISASEIRKMYIDGSDADRNQIITDLYGSPDPRLRDIFDQKLGLNEKIQGIIYGKEIIDDNSMSASGPMSPVQREHKQKLIKMLESVLRLERRVYDHDQLPVEYLCEDYLDEKRHKI